MKTSQPTSSLQKFKKRERKAKLQVTPQWSRQTNASYETFYDKNDQVHSINQRCVEKYGGGRGNRHCSKLKGISEKWEWNAMCVMGLKSSSNMVATGGHA